MSRDHATRADSDAGSGDDDTLPLYVAAGPWSEPRGFDPSLVRAVVAKTVTRMPRDGNPGDTILDLGDGSWLNWQGLPNPGIQSFIDDVLPRYEAAAMPVIASLAGDTADDLVECVELLAASPIAGIELNVSCPNAVGYDARVMHDTLAQIDTQVPVFVKMPPNPFAIDDMAAEVTAAADQISAVVCGNSMPAAAWQGVTLERGGMSGVALKPVALRVAAGMVAATDVPVIGCGGIRSADDAIDFLRVGCAAVQVGSASMRDWQRLEAIAMGLAEAGALS